MELEERSQQQVALLDFQEQTAVSLALSFGSGIVAWCIGE